MILKNILPLYNWTSGAIIMTVVFGLVCVGIVAALLLMMKVGKKKSTNK